VIQPDVCDDPDIGPQHFVLGDVLQAGVHRHTFNDKNLSLLLYRLMENPQLLLDICLAASMDGTLYTVHTDGHGKSSGGFAEYPPAPGTQSGLDQPGHSGFSADAVDVDYVFQLVPVSQCPALFHAEIHQNNSQQCCKQNFQSDPSLPFFSS
jgi:hypothetical protein